MEQLYLKRMTDKDINLLTEYNKDFLSHGINTRINESNFKEWLEKIESTCLDDTQVHAFPYFLMLDDKPIGMPIIKTNIEGNNIWSRYGGNISYVISPSFRKKHYGTKCLHLILEECLKLGLSSVKIMCDARNIGSKKVIENNYGVLESTFIENSDIRKGTFNYRYVIDTNLSLLLYKEKKKKISPTLKQRCNIDRTNPEDFLFNIKQGEINEDLRLSTDVNKLELLKKIYKEFLENFNYNQNKDVDEYERTVSDIISSETFYGNNEVALVLSSILRLNNIPTLCVFSTDYNKTKTYTFLEIYLDNKWYLFDPLKSKLYFEYDYNNLCLPDNYYAFMKAPSNYSFGIYKKEDLEIFIKTTTINETYKNPEYEYIDLKSNEDIKKL